MQTIYSIFRLRRATSKAMFQSNTLNQNGHNESLGVKMARFDDDFLKTALRISTYPIALIIVNGLISGMSTCLLRFLRDKGLMGDELLIVSIRCRPLYIERRRGPLTHGIRFLLYLLLFIRWSRDLFRPGELTHFLW